MKEQISEAIAAAIQQLVADGEVAQSFDKSIQVTRTKDASHGDFASNIALLFAKQVGKNPRELALSLSQHLTQSNVFDRVEVAGPGFCKIISFFV